MNKEQIKDDFIKEAQKLIKSKRDPINELSGNPRFEAIHNHLEGFNDFVKELNILLNKILDKHSVVFKSVEDSEVFSEFIKPTFEETYKSYLEGLL